MRACLGFPWSPLLALVPIACSAGMGLMLGGCAEEAAQEHEGAWIAAGDPASEAVRELVQAVTPLPASAGGSQQNEWHARRRGTLERMRSAGPHVGAEAWRYYRRERAAPTDVRIGLLDVAAHNVPHETLEHLCALVTEFGEELALRRAACSLLATSAPHTALEVLEPILTRGLRKGTYPPEDKMLAAWVQAKRSLGEDPTDLLTTIAADLTQYDEARHFAIRELAGTQDRRALGALEQLVVESGTNSYLRRLAAQSLQQSLTAEDFCTRIRAVIEREADQNFQLFLMSMKERYCP